MHRALVLVALAGTVTAGMTAAAADRRKPRRVADPHPHAATQGFIFKLAAGTWPLADYVDPEAGVVYLDELEGMADTARAGEARLLCGEALRKRLPKIRRALYDKLLGDYATGGLACHNRPGLPTCTAGSTTEGDTLFGLAFRDDPTRGLRLIAVFHDDDEVHTPEDVRADDRVHRQRAIERLAAPGCPAATTPPPPPPPPPAP